jgi:hypothetical protein
VGGSLDLTVEANGSDPLSYSWKKDGQVLIGKNFEHADAQPADRPGRWKATSPVVTNNDGTAEERPSHGGPRLCGPRSDARRRGEPVVDGLRRNARAAIDGNTDGNFNGNSVTHTNDGDLTPTWEVLLLRPEHGRRDLHLGPHRLLHEPPEQFQVSVLDIDRNESWSDSFFTTK